MIKVIHFYRDGCKNLEDMISGIDPDQKLLCTFESEILFDDLLKIQEE